MTPERSSEHVVRVVLKNGTKEPARLLLRPFGGYYEMAAGLSYEIRARGPASGTLTIEQVEGGTIVSGWPGCILSVHSVKRPSGSYVIERSPAAAPHIELRQELHPVDDDEDVQ